MARQEAADREFLDRDQRQSIRRSLQRGTSHHQSHGVQTQRFYHLTNLFGYSEFKGNNAVDAFGLNAPTVANPTLPTDYFSFVPINPHPDFGLTANQKSIVEELRLTGDSGPLTWQAGLYYEKSSPKSFTGTLSVTAGNCFDITTYKCTNSTGATAGPTKMWNETYAAYAQATYRLSEQFAITAGLRYTEDKTRSVFSNGRVRFTPADNWVSNTYECGFPGHPDAGPNPFLVTLRYPNTRANRDTLCFNDRSKKTSAPTWTINLEYKPNSDILTYAKWSRGYRQGGIVPATGLPEFVAYDAEKIDAFELGAKTSWGGAVRGMFNVAAFYNKFGSQQIQAGINTSGQFRSDNHDRLRAIGALWFGSGSDDRTSRLVQA